MKQILTSKVRAILIAAVVLAVLTALALLIAAGGTTVGRNVTNTLLSPFRSGMAALTRQAEQLYGYLFEYDSLVAENRELKLKLSEMEQTARENEQIARENERLLELLHLTEQNTDYKLVPTYITATSGSHWSNTLTLDRGQNSGIETGMCAITEYGEVVGIVTEVGRNWSTVTTIRDASSEVPASVASTGDSGIVQGAWQTGSAYTLRLNYLDTASIPKNGDQVLTSGSSMYPKGLVLGTIAGAGFDETGVSKYADLNPAADFDSLEQVFIITTFVN